MREPHDFGTVRTPISALPTPPDSLPREPRDFGAVLRLLEYLKERDARPKSHEDAAAAFSGTFSDLRERPESPEADGTLRAMLQAEFNEQAQSGRPDLGEWFQNLRPEAFNQSHRVLWALFPCCEGLPRLGDCIGPRHGKRGCYQLVSILGVGSTSVVFRALDRRTGRHVAVKVMRRFETERAAEVAKAMFDKEWSIGVRLEALGDRVIRAYDRGTLHGGARLPFLVMRLQPQTWAEYTRTHNLSCADVARLLLQLAEIVVEIAKLGVFWRDVKPNNVFVTARGKVVAGDFGLAHSPDYPVDDAAMGFRPDVVIGSPRYAPDEQRPGDPDHRDETHGIGVMGRDLCWVKADRYLRKILRSATACRERRPTPAKLCDELRDYLAVPPEVRSYFRRVYWVIAWVVVAGVAWMAQLHERQNREKEQHERETRERKLREAEWEQRLSGLPAVLNNNGDVVDQFGRLQPKWSVKPPAEKYLHVWTPAGRQLLHEAQAKWADGKPLTTREALYLFNAHIDTFSPEPSHVGLEAAVKLYSRLTAMHPKERDRFTSLLRLEMGLACLRLGWALQELSNGSQAEQFRGAARYFSEAIDHLPVDDRLYQPTAMSCLAYTHVQLGLLAEYENSDQAESAIRTAERAIQLATDKNPHQFDFHNTALQAYVLRARTLGHWESADHERAIRITERLVSLYWGNNFPQMIRAASLRAELGAGLVPPAKMMREFEERH